MWRPARLEDELMVSRCSYLVSRKKNQRDLGLMKDKERQSERTKKDNHGAG
jgi:hypothetical protein